MYLRFEKKRFYTKTENFLKLSRKIAHQSNPSAFFKVSSV